MRALLLTAQTPLQPLGWCLLGIVGLLGLLALVSPRVFARIASEGSRWIDTNRILACLDKRYDVDHLVLPFSRWLGALVIASVLVLGFVLARL